MKLITFTYQQQTRIGAVIGNEVVDVLAQPALPCNMIDFLTQGETAKALLQQQIDAGTERLPLNAVTLHAPIPRPGKYLAIGLNYPEHLNETGLAKPDYPLFFNKQTSCIIAHHEAIHLPKVSEKLDYEGELAIVIGKRCRHVPVEKAHQVIAGFTIANDVSVRDWQMRSPTWTLGKSFDTHGPLGPWLVTTDEIADPHQLNLRTWVDDELRQQSNTGQMLFNCYEMIAYLTQVMCLEPGDVIATGTPSGVGVKMKPRGYLKAGQTVRIEIEKIGTLTNLVINEPDDLTLY